MRDARLRYVCFVGGLSVGLAVSAFGALLLALGRTPTYGVVPGLFAMAPLILGGAALLAVAVAHPGRRGR